LINTKEKKIRKKRTRIIQKTKKKKNNNNNNKNKNNKFNIKKIIRKYNKILIILLSKEFNFIIIYI